MGDPSFPQKEVEACTRARSFPIRQEAARVRRGREKVSAEKNDISLNKTPGIKKIYVSLKKEARSILSRPAKTELTQNLRASCGNQDRGVNENRKKKRIRFPSIAERKIRAVRRKLDAGLTGKSDLVRDAGGERRAQKGQPSGPDQRTSPGPD